MPLAHCALLYYPSSTSGRGSVLTVFLSVCLFIIIGIIQTVNEWIFLTFGGNGEQVSGRHELFECLKWSGTYSEYRSYH